MSKIFKLILIFFLLNFQANTELFPKGEKKEVVPAEESSEGNSKIYAIAIAGGVALVGTALGVYLFRIKDGDSNKDEKKRPEVPLKDPDKEKEPEISEKDKEYLRELFGLPRQGDGLGKESYVATWRGKEIKGEKEIVEAFEAAIIDSDLKDGDKFKIEMKRKPHGYQSVLVDPKNPKKHLEILEDKDCKF